MNLQDDYALQDVDTSNGNAQALTRCECLLPSGSAKTCEAGAIVQDVAHNGNHEEAVDTTLPAAPVSDTHEPPARSPADTDKPPPHKAVSSVRRLTDEQCRVARLHRKSGATWCERNGHAWPIPVVSDSDGA